MSILQVEQEKCVGCGACAQVCPQKAICATEDEKGFVYPVLDTTICVSCDLCEKVCPAIDTTKTQACAEEPKAYGCYLHDESKMENSASGGAFVVLSDWVLDGGGVVAGATMDDDFYVIHRIAETREQRNKQCGSKYVHSDTWTIYTQIKQCLKDNKIVLFAGTPCQVNAVKKFCGAKLEDRLYTIDIFCRGVPGQKVFRDYKTWLEAKYGDIASYCFRDRKLGRHGSNVRIGFCSGKQQVNTLDANVFDSLYSRGYLMRPNCYQCPYTSLKREGDLSVGDFWGIEKIQPKWAEKEGVSLVLVNTVKGTKVWEAVKNNTEYLQVQICDAMQPCLQTPREKPLDYNGFWKHYQNHGFASTVKVYAKYGRRSYLHKKAIYFGMKVKRLLKIR